uniref:Dynein heavy chain tail domain-containing protein n=1 Tax=Eptatretus burgeri TaxID=7764 RepID=A0A8C4PXS7_EPTBU
MSKQKEMIFLLEKFENSIFKSWTKGVDSVCQMNLQEHLLIRDTSSRLLSLNFKKELVSMLKEVRYLLKMKWNDIPSGLLDLHSKTDTYHKFVTTLELLVTSYNKDWLSLQLFKCKDKKSESLLDIVGPSTSLERSSKSIHSGGDHIHELLLENQTLFKAELDDVAWQAYLAHVDATLFDGLTNIINNSFQMLLTNMDLQEAAVPMFEVRLELDTSELIFKPSLEINSPGGMYDLMRNQLDDIYRIAANVGRPVLGKPSFQTELEEMESLSQTRNQILSNVVNAMVEALDYKALFEDFSSLWIESRTEFFAHFLTRGISSRPDELRAQEQRDQQACPPTLEDFKCQVPSSRCHCEENSQTVALKNGARDDE